eukprot:scpid57353/ scgid13554/ 
MDALMLAKDVVLVELVKVIPDDVKNLEESEVRLIAYTTAVVLVLTWLWSFFESQEKLVAEAEGFLIRILAITAYCEWLCEIRAGQNIDRSHERRCFSHS